MGKEIVQIFFETGKLVLRDHRRFYCTTGTVHEDVNMAELLEDLIPRSLKACLIEYVSGNCDRITACCPDIIDDSLPVLHIPSEHRDLRATHTKCPRIHAADDAGATSHNCYFT